MNKLTEDVLEAALRALRAGEIILTPTDTIWGLSCDATNETAIHQLKAVKHRPADKSFIVLMASEEMLRNYVSSELADRALALVERPTTVIYPEVAGVSEEVKAADGSLAVRIPAVQWLRKLITAFGCPIVSTSANISGDPSPENFTTIHHSIKDAVDYTLPQYLELKNQPPSRIIKLLGDGEMIVVRD